MDHNRNDNGRQVVNNEGRRPKNNNNATQEPYGSKFPLKEDERYAVWNGMAAQRKWGGRQ